MTRPLTWPQAILRLVLRLGIIVVAFTTISCVAILIFSLVGFPDEWPTNRNELRVNFGRLNGLTIPEAEKVLELEHEAHVQPGSASIMLGPNFGGFTYANLTLDAEGRITKAEVVYD